MKKRVLSLALALCLCLTLLPAASAAANPYPQYNYYYSPTNNQIACTWYAWQQVSDNQGIALPAWGNGGSWYGNAAASGYATGSTPAAGSIACWSAYNSPPYGHVAYVTGVNGDGSFNIVEGGSGWPQANWQGICSRTVRAGQYWPDQGFIYTGGAASRPTVSFAPWESANYTYIRETDASIGQVITVSGGSCTETGMHLYDAAGNYLASGRNSSYTYAQVYFQVNAELGYTLTPGTTYKYKFYAVVNGETYWGSEGSFTTAGTPPVTAPTVTFNPWSNDNYTYIRETDASIGQEILVTNGTCTETGMHLYDAAGNYLAAGRNDAYTLARVYFQVNAELGYTLTPGTTYKYKFYAVVNGETYWGPEGSFTTAGTAPVEYAVALDRSTLTLEVGETATLTAAVSPAGTPVTWTSSDTAVAAVSGGKVTAAAPGSAVITAAAGDKTARCTVTVRAPEETVPPEETLPPEAGVHFPRVAVYFQGQFTDVPADQWYTGNVADAFAFGLMQGDSAVSFDPYGDVTIAEAVTMAARIHSIYTTGTEDFRQTGDSWYRVYMDYAYANGIIGLAYYRCDGDQRATRAQFAEIFANSLPAGALAEINTVPTGAIPDVKSTDPYAGYVYRLYRAGVLTGSDANGTFFPQTYITRAEAAAIVSRMAESNNRVSFSLSA